MKRILVFCAFSALTLAPAGASEARIDWSGYVEGRYQQRERPAGKETFTLNRSRIGFKAAPVPDWIAVIRLAPEAFNNGSGLRQAYVEHAPWDGVWLRAGQFTVPSTRENAISSADLDFVNRARTITEFFFSPDALDIGAAAGAARQLELAIPAPVRLEAEAGLVNGSGANRGDDTQNKTAVGRVHARWPWLTLGGSFFAGDRLAVSTGAPVAQERYSAELAIGPENRCLRAELWHARDDATPRRSIFVSAFSDVPMAKQWRLGARWERLDPDTRVSGEEFTTVSGVVHYWPNDSVRLSFQWNHLNERFEREQVIAQVHVRFAATSFVGLQKQN